MEWRNIFYFPSADKVCTASALSLHYTQTGPDLLYGPHHPLLQEGEDPRRRLQFLVGLLQPLLALHVTRLSDLEAGFLVSLSLGRPYLRAQGSDVEEDADLLIGQTRHRQ